MIEPTNDISGNIDANQKRSRFEDPKDARVRLITYIAVYCGQYYPATKELAKDLVRVVVEKYAGQLCEALGHLYGCLERQIITGPSSSYVPPFQQPLLTKQNLSLSLQHPHEDELKELQKVHQQLNLNKIIPRQRLSQLMWYNCSKFLSMKSIQQSNTNYKLYSSQLQIDGQNWLESTPLSWLLAFMQFILEFIVKQVKMSVQHEIKVKLIWARLSYLHNKHLKSPVKKLSNIVLTNYKEILAITAKKTTFQDYIQLLLEYAFSLLFYYKYSQCQTIIRHCSHLLKMKMEFTGKLGRRTKFQTFDTPLLVMDLVSNQNKQPVQSQHQKQPQDEEGQKVELIDANELILKERGLDKSQQNEGLNASKFDEESILLQTPKFVEEESANIQLKEITQHHLLSALAVLYFQWKSTPHDQMLLQNITAAINTLLKYKIPTSFSYSFALLLLRSLNEFPKLKNTQRALDQLQKLKLSFNGRDKKDTHNLYATPYQTHLEYVLILANKYMQIGLSMTAVQLFEEAGLFEECIDGLIAKSYKEKALELANRLIESKGKSARLLCMFGDITKGEEVKYYEQAWQFSNGTYARAQRSLGWYYFNKNEFEKAADSFAKATQASYYHPSTWYTLGCSYMRLKQYEKALKAFSECISIDDTQGQAWGNMASCYIFNKKFSQAYVTLIQAVKHSQANWKLWANLLSVSLTMKKFYKYIECIERLVKLQHQQVLTQQVLAKVVQIIKFQSETVQRRRILFSFKNRIDRMYQFLSEKIGENELVWGSLTKYQIEMLEYIDILYTHYHNLHIQNKIDVNDLVPGYQTIELTTIKTKIEILETKEKIVGFKQTQLNMTMKVGWDSNKSQCQRVKTALEGYIDIYRQYSNRKDQQDFKLFVGGISQKIGHCLEQVYIQGLEWL